MEKKARASLESGAFIGIAAGVLVAINAFGAFGGFGKATRIDTTYAKRFTLSEGSGRLLRSMKQDMHVDAYVTKGLPKLDAFVRDLRDLLQQYQESSGGRFSYAIIEAKDEETKRSAKEAGLKEVPFGEASETNEQAAAVAMGFMGMVMKYGSEKEVIEYLPPERTDGLEFWITNKVRQLRDTGDSVKHRLGVLTGHDEMKLSEPNLVPTPQGKPSIQAIMQQSFPFYSFVDVDTHGGAEAIDESLDGLIVMQPGKDIDEKDLKRIDEFVLKGKSLVVVAGAVNVKANDATMKAELSTRGLEKLLGGYGIEVRKDVVLDYGRSMRLQMLTQGGLAIARFPQVLDVIDDPRFSGQEQLLDTNFPAFFRIQELAFPFASSVAVAPEKQPEAKLQVLARSTPRALVEKSDTVDLRPFQRWNPKGEFGQFGLAAAAEGTLKSAFGDEKSKAPARVLVIASSQFLANPFARAGNAPDMGQMGMMFGGMGGDESLLQVAMPYAQKQLSGAILAFKNMCDWATGDTDLLAVSAKILSEPGLVYGDVGKIAFDPNETEEQVRAREDELKKARKTTQRAVEVILIPGVPLLMALIGVLRWQSRKKARANVSLA